MNGALIAKYLENNKEIFLSDHGTQMTRRENSRYVLRKTDNCFHAEDLEYKEHRFDCSGSSGSFGDVLRWVAGRIQFEL